MKIISLLEPWASLMLLGHKLNETRSWNTDYRGDVAIASSKTLHPDDKQIIRGLVDHPHQKRWRNLVFEALEVKQPEECIELLQRTAGHILVVVNLNRTVSTNTHPLVSSRESMFGNYTPGRFVWMTNDRRPLSEPIPWHGQLGLRDVPDDVEAEIRRRL